MFLNLGKVTVAKSTLDAIKAGTMRDFLGVKANGVIITDSDEAAGTVTVVVMNNAAFSTVFVPSYTVELGDHSDTWTVSLI